MKKIISLILVLVMFCCIIPITAYASDVYHYNAKKEELYSIHDRVEYALMIDGELRPYTNTSYQLLIDAMESADELLCKDSATVSDSEYQECIDNLTFAYENICIKPHFAKETYVLSLKEQNKNGFYDEDKWSDFTTKRDALRDSFKTNDEYVISDAYFALENSFIKMTSGYKSGDVNNDGKVNIDDATLVQKYLAGQEDLTELQKELVMSYDNYIYDGLDIPKPNIDCVTGLQKCVAGLTKQHTLPFSYGVNYTDSFGVTYNTKLVLYTHIWPATEEYDYVKYVTTKTAELEAEGII